MSRTFAEHQYELLRGRARTEPTDLIHFFDDFFTVPIDDTTSLPTGWSETADAGATAQTGPIDGKGGILQVACDGDDNDEAYLSSNEEGFIVNADDDLVFATRVKHAAGSTAGKGSFIVGLSDTVGANSITDAGSIMASFDGIVFIKGEDDNIDIVSSNAASQSRTEVATFEDDTWVELGFVVRPNKDGTTVTVMPLVNGVQPLDADGDPISHELTISGMGEMHMLLGVKTHEAAEQTLECDWLEVVQDR